MINLYTLDNYRVSTPACVNYVIKSQVSLQGFGEFKIPIDEKSYFFVGASTDFGWDHIALRKIVKMERSSVEVTPIANEVEYIKKLFFRDEVAIEVHPKKEDYVNLNHATLHLWRPNRNDLIMPPKIAEFEEQDFIPLNGENGKSLLIKTVRTEDGWECYEVNVYQQGRPTRHKPSWDEMCVAKKAICGEDTVALQYHIPDSEVGPYSNRLWVIPKSIEMPLPRPCLVGVRNEEDDKEFKLMWAKEHGHKWK